MPIIKRGDADPEGEGGSVVHRPHPPRTRPGIAHEA
jgi:hypothetical protein